MDRDYVEESNLQRQSLFDEEDARGGPAQGGGRGERGSRALNSDVEVRGIVADVSPENADALVARADARPRRHRQLRHALPAERRLRARWRALGVRGLRGRVRPRAARAPGVSPCLRCVLETSPRPGSGPTCDTAGVVAPIVQVVAGLQAGEALKVLAGRTESVLQGLVSVDLWAGTFDVLDLSREGAVVSRVHGRTLRVRGEKPGLAMCFAGETLFRYGPQPGVRVNLDALAARLRAVGEVLLERLSRALSRTRS